MARSGIVSLICKFYSCRIPKFILSLELFESVKVFILAWNLITQKTSFKYGACVPYWQVHVTGNFNK